jgi:acyl-CoA thioesterase
MDDGHGAPEPSTTHPTRFEAETSVQRVAPGEYRAEVVRSWWIVNGPNGGFVAALVLRAIVAEVDDPQRRPRSLTLHYLRAPAEGPVRIDVTVERSGRTVTNVSARMSQDGRTMVLALAALAVDRDSPVAFDDRPGLPTLEDGSAVPLPEQVPPTEVDRDRDVPLREHYDLRWVLGDPPFQPREAGAVARCGGWLRPAEAVAIDEVALAAMSDAWLPPIFSRHAVALAVPTIDLTVHFRSLPSDPLDFCFVEFDSPVAHAGYLVEHGRLWDRHGRLLAESRQLAVLA